MARSEKTTGPGSIADTVAMLAVWARHAPRGFARVEYHSEYARAEADRRLGEVLLREEVPYHHVELSVRVTPSQAGRYLLEHLETIESGAVSITGFATAVAEEDRRDFLAILSVRREVLAEFGLCQIWWLTPDFLDALIGIAPDLDSWFMVRLHLEEEFVPPAGERYAADSTFPVWPTNPIDGALRRAASLVERFQQANELGTEPLELIMLAASAADAIVNVRAPELTERLTDQLVSGLNEVCQGKMVDCLSTLRSLLSFVGLLVTHRRDKEAAPLIERARALVERGERPDRPDVVRNLLNVAGLYLDDNQMNLAESLYRRALEIAEEVNGPEHPDVARCLSSLARLMWLTGRPKEAEVLCRRALAINEKNVGSDHPDVAAALGNLADVLRSTGRMVEAEPLYLRALAIEERALGPDHPAVAYDLSNLAVLLRATNHLDEAESLFRRALAIDERSLGPDHPAVARDLVHLASVLEDIGRLTEAEALLRLRVAIDERIYPPVDSSVVRDRRHLASLLKATDRLDEAEAMLR